MFPPPPKKKNQSRSYFNHLVSNGNAVQSKEWICSRLLAGIAGSNPTGNMDVNVVCSKVEVCAPS